MEREREESKPAPIVGPNAPSVAIYVRVSTEEQADSGLSLPNQEKRCRAFALSQGWKVVHVYREDGASGLDEHGRPEYRKMMAARKGWGILLSTKPDRVHRSEENMETLIETARIEGKQFWTIESGRRDEYKGAYNELARKLTDASMPQAESESISQRVLPNVEEAKASSIHVGRPPAGMIWNPITKSFETTDWARRIEREYAALKGSGIADREAKAEAGRRNPYPGGKFEGRPVSLTAVERILGNLKGRTPNEERTPRGFWSKLQTPELYRSAEAGEKRLADEFKEMTDQDWRAYCVKRARMGLDPPGVPCPKNRDVKDRNWDCFEEVGGVRKRNPRPPIKVARSFRTTQERDRHVRREHLDGAKPDAV